MKRNDPRHNARPHYQTRRELLRDCGAGFGALTLSALLPEVPPQEPLYFPIFPALFPKEYQHRKAVSTGNLRC